MNNFKDYVVKYQNDKYDEFRMKNPEYKNYSNEEIEAMDPITLHDIIYLKELYIMELRKIIDALQTEINHDEEMISSGKLHYNAVTELRQDVLYEQREVAKYENMIKSSEAELEEMKEKLGFGKKM